MAVATTQVNAIRVVILNGVKDLTKGDRSRQIICVLRASIARSLAFARDDEDHYGVGIGVGEGVGVIDGVAVGVGVEVATGTEVIGVGVGELVVPSLDATVSNTIVACDDVVVAAIVAVGFGVGVAVAGGTGVGVGVASGSF